MYLLKTYLEDFTNNYYVAGPLQFINMLHIPEKFGEHCIRIFSYTNSSFLQLESVAVSQPGQNRINHTVIRIALLFLLKVVYSTMRKERRTGKW